MEPEFDAYGEPVMPPELGIGGALIAAGAALYLSVSDLLTARVFLVAALRTAIGAAVMAGSALLPGPLSSIGTFAGKMFVFLALYGLVTPLESRITGGLADRILRPSPRSQKVKP